MPLFKLSVQCVLLATISVGLYAQPLRQSTASPALSAPSQQPQASKDSFAYTYFVQTGTFRSELDAQNQVDKLNGARVAADISVGSNDNRPVYRVRVGPFQNKDEYDAVASRVRARGFDPVIVRISAGSANASGTTKGAAAQTANGKSLPSDGFEVAPVQCFTTQHRPVPGSERNPNGKTENTYYVNRCTFPIIVIGCIAVKQRMNEKHQSFVESCSTRNQNGVFEMTLGAMVTDPSNPYYRQVMPGRLPAGYDQPQSGHVRWKRAPLLHPPPRG